MMKTRVYVTIILSAYAVGACAAPAKRGDVPAVPSSTPAATQATQATQAGQVEKDPPAWCEGLPVEIEEIRGEDGTLQLRQSVVKDKEGKSVRHGPLLRFWESGKKKLEVQYQCGVKHGTRTAWHRNGTKWSVGRYVNGLDHGVWTEWTADGKKTQEFAMKYGVWHGLHTQWYPNGTKKREVRYVNGLIQGPLVFWNDSGTLLATIDFVDGKEQPTPQ